MRLPRPLAQRLSFETKVALRKYARQFTGWLRVLPDFIIVGAQKGGTTSLFSYLRQHPEVRSSYLKEVHYFDEHYERGERWYRSHFPSLFTMALLRLKTGGRGLTGEASPGYLLHPHAARRIAKAIPDVKLIFLLRNPTDRAFSHYHHQVRLGNEELSLPEAIEQEEKRIGEEREKVREDPTHSSLALRRRSYKGRGEYASRIRRYLEYFDMDQMLFVKSEHFFRDRGRVLQETYDFLGLKPHAIRGREARARNVGQYEEQAHADARKRLREHFAPHNRDLGRLLGDRFEVWDE